MKDEIAREIGYMEIAAEALHNYGIELRAKETQPFSSKREAGLREKANELIQTLQTTAKDVHELAERYEWANGETEEGSDIKAIGDEVAGEVGGLGATCDLATGELPRWGGTSRSMADAGTDFMRASETLKRLATRLEKIAARARV
jgi:hypothetical protein